jgi:hypothetical protein
VARPLRLVAAVFTPPANVAVAPFAGEVNVTTTPGTGFPLLSDTSATSGIPKAVLTAVLCGVPLDAATNAGGPTTTVLVPLLQPAMHKEIAEHRAMQRALRLTDAFLAEIRTGFLLVARQSAKRRKPSRRSMTRERSKVASFCVSNQDLVAQTRPSHSALRG